MSVKFGTGGWRAVIADGFTKANVQLLAAALAQKMKDEAAAENGFVIGYDRRFLSREAAQWAAEVLAGAGIVCLLIDREAPTPLVMFSVKYYGLSYGMTSDEVLSTFVTTEVTALKNGAKPSGLNSLQQSAADVNANLTGVVGAVQDLVTSECKTDLFANVQNVVTGAMWLHQL